MKVRYRSAITGQFISRKYAKRHPKTTVGEMTGNTSNMITRRRNSGKRRRVSS